MFVTRNRPMLYLSTGEGPGAGEGLTAQPSETAANTPVEGTGTQETTPQENWEQRYLDAQRWGTTNAQSAAQWQRIQEDPDARKTLFQELLAENGYVLPDEEDEPDQPGPQVDPETARRLQAFEEWQAQQSQSEQQEAEAKAFRQVIDPMLKAKQVPDGLHDMVREIAQALPPIQVVPSAEFPAGLQPNVDQAMEHLQEMILSGSELPGVRNKIIEQYRRTKQTAHLPSSGQAGTQAGPLGSHNARVRRALELAANDEL